MRCLFVWNTAYCGLMQLLTAAFKAFLRISMRGTETNFIQDVWKMKQCYQRSKLVLPLSFIFCLYNSVCRNGVWWRPNAEVVDPCPDLQIRELCHNMSPEQAVCFDSLTFSLGGFLWILRIWISRNRVVQKVDIRRADSLDVAQGPLWSDILRCCACTKDMSAAPVFDCSVCRCAYIPIGANNTISICIRCDCFYSFAILILTSLIFVCSKYRCVSTASVRLTSLEEHDVSFIIQLLDM
jgi:hypothetical protein